MGTWIGAVNHLKRAPYASFWSHYPHRDVCQETLGMLPCRLPLVEKANRGNSRAGLRHHGSPMERSQPDPVSIEKRGKVGQK